MNATKNRIENKKALPNSRKLLFWGLTALLPFALFASLELALRWLDYGTDISLFKKETIRGEIFLRMNHDVKFRYFGNSRFAPSTSPDYFRARKPIGTYRIFVLGGSTTVGFPYYYNGAFSAFLKQRLETLFPQRDVEVINLGMTATNSYTALDIGSELAGYQPDLIIDYDGHNEFYGALGAASNQTAGSFRFVTLLMLRAVHLKTFQLIGSTIEKISGFFTSGNEFPARGTEMETLAKGRYVRYGSRLHQSACSIFRDNINDLAEYCRSAHVPIIFGTQVSNLRQQPPFISEHAPEMSEARIREFQRHFDDGTQFLAKNMEDSAEAAYQSAIDCDSLFADAHYRLAQCLDRQQRFREALHEYILARDFDELRFRTDTKFNDLIRSMSGGCYVADIEREFKSDSPDSLIGFNLITEHLHPNARGYFLIAKEYVRVMRDGGLFASREEWQTADTVSDEALWDKRVITDLDERMASHHTKILTSGWPFSENERTALPVPGGDTLNGIADDAAAGRLDWRQAHAKAIAFYQRRGDWNLVEQEERALVSEIPLDLELYMDLARVEFRLRRFDEMAAILRRSLKIYPTIQACRTLGDVLMQKGDAAGAVVFYEKADGFAQSQKEKLQNGYALGFAYARAAELQKAKARLEELLKEAPDFLPARQLLEEVNRGLQKTAKIR